jgi:hypothetical protein
MRGGLRGGRPSRAATYGPAMNMQRTVAPRSATLDHTTIRREGRTTNRRTGLTAAAAGALVALALAACSPGSSSPLPIGSPVLPSINASAIASAAAGAALAALDQVDAAIAANQTATGLTADDASALTQLTAGARTALQTGDATAAKTAVDNLGTKVAALAAKLNNATGQQLTVAIAALKAALPAG